jgi:PAS domain S-box-containing protein
MSAPFLQVAREDPSGPRAGAPDESRRLRRTMRDLVALSTLPAIWTGLGRTEIASSLGDVLLSVLSLELVYVQLGGDENALVEVLRTRQQDAARIEAAKALLSEALKTARGDLPTIIPDPFDAGTLRIVTIRFGVGSDSGVLIAGSRRAAFPTEQDRLLLGVGANQTAIAVQRLRTEEHIHQQREWLQVTLASIGDAVVATDMEGRVAFLNAVAEEMTGWTGDSAKGEPLGTVFRVVDEEGGQSIDAAIAQVLREGEALGMIGRPVLIAKDGAEHAVDISASPIRSLRGDMIGAVMVFRVATARRREEQHRNARLAITEVLNQSISVEEAAAGFLRAVCENLRWDAGFFWLVDDEGQRLRCKAHWSPSGADPSHLLSQTHQCTFAAGEGLPGRVWALRKPAWISDLAQDGNFPRLAGAVLDGFRCAFACPVTIAGEVIGVIEFFTPRICEEDPDLLEMMTTAATSAGQFIERKWAEDELRRSEQELSEFFENAVVGMHWVGPDGKVIRVNRAELEMLGYSREEYLGRHIAEFHADEEVICDILDRLRAGEKLTEYPARLRCKDGTIKHVLIDSSVRWKDDQFVHTRCFTRDVTQRTLAEAALADARARLQAALDAGSIATWTWDIPNNRLFADDNLAQLFNLPPREANGGALDRYVEAIHPEDVARVMAALDLAVERDELYEADYRVVQADGSVRWVAARGKAERDGKGRPVRMPGVLVDITARKQLEDALRDADRRKDEFLATLAHELRNPLAPIRNSLEILKMPRVDSGTLQQIRAMMERQVDHLVRLVDDLLDVSRVMKGKIELRKEQVELANVVARAVETVQPLIAVQGHRLDLSLPHESLLLQADPVRLAQVVGNLLTNAAKYTEANGHIWLTTTREGNDVVLSVRDNGIGMAPDLLPHVFELFVQADHTSTKAQGGLGIGLTLARNLVHLHGGTIEARSAGLGKGSEFVVRLPLLARQDESPREQPEADGFLERPSSGRRVLVVDDNQDAAMTLATLLRMLGHDVEVAHDGAAAVSLATTFVPHVVFLDIGMPGMDGYEVARRLRAQPGMKAVVLAALTGWGQKEDRRRTSEAGFDHHLVKPLEIAALERVLSAL